MDKKNLDLVLNQFIARYEELDNPDTNNEGYKWKAVATFKKYWDIKSDNFPQMFADALSDTSNLIDNATVQPIGGIKMLLSHENEVEFVRSAFDELFSEDHGDLEDRNHRINAFMDKINAKIDQYYSGSWKYPQSRASVIYYLNLWKPEENYIFKSTEATEWANCVEFGGDFGSGTIFSLAEYYRMCDELKAKIRKNETIVEFNKQRVNRTQAESGILYEDDLNIMVYDIIYCAHAYSFYKDMDIMKTSTKDRIKRAAKRGKKDKLEAEITDLKAKLSEIEKQLTDITIPVGSAIIHKKFGEGRMQEIIEGRVVVAFGEVNKTFQYPNAFENGFLKVSDEVIMNTFSNNAIVLKEQKELQGQLTQLERQLES